MPRLCRPRWLLLVVVAMISMSIANSQPTSGGIDRPHRFFHGGMNLGVSADLAPRAANLHAGVLRLKDVLSEAATVVDALERQGAQNAAGLTFAEVSRVMDQAAVAHDDACDATEEQVRLAAHHKGALPRLLARDTEAGDAVLRHEMRHASRSHALARSSHRQCERFRREFEAVRQRFQRIRDAALANGDSRLSQPPSARSLGQREEL